MKYSEQMAEWLIDEGYTHCFFVAGGGIMHLLDGFRTKFECIPVVHEVSAGICAEHFNECVEPGGGRAFALVTTGPGIANIVSAIAGCYVEHRELLVIAGQVKSVDMLKHPERQRGVQEVDGKSICQPVSVVATCLTAPISEHAFKSLIRSARTPHPGPVVVEVCLDVQGAAMGERSEPLNGDQERPTETGSSEPNGHEIDLILSDLQTAQRPLFLLGGLVSRSVAARVMPILEEKGIPTCTTTSAIDRIPTNSAIFAGRPGTWGGQRAANMILAQADVVVALGAQLDLQQTGFNYEKYIPNGKLVHVFPSSAELARAGPVAALKLNASPDQTLEQLAGAIGWQDTIGWLNYVQMVRELVPVVEPENEEQRGYIHSFSFFQNLSRAADASDILALCSSGGTFTGALQTYEVKLGQRATTSPAHASMGYGLATAVGAAFSSPGSRVILTEGEGGFSQNLQELAIVSRYKLPIKIFLIENNGYASIRATQKKFFGGSYLGCDAETGLGFPDWIRLFEAYGIPAAILSDTDISTEQLSARLSASNGPSAWIVPVHPEQTNWPAVSTVLADDGKMTSGPISEMLPALPENIHSRVTRFL